jgi:hypothetical protein
MKPRWWTCGCGARNVTRELGTPVCAACSKPASFTIKPPQGQGGFDFLRPRDPDEAPLRGVYRAARQGGDA